MIDKNNLPQRLYYTLPDAAKVLGCEVRDIIHYAAIHALQLSVYIKRHHCETDSWFHLNMPSSKVDDIDIFSMLRGDGWEIDFVEFKSKSEKFFADGYYAKAVSGFFYVDGYNLIPLEFNESDEISLVGVSTLPSFIDGQCIDVNFMMNHLKVNSNYLCVRKNDMDFINKNVSMPSKDLNSESRKTTAKKSELIFYLLKMIPELSCVDLEREKITKIASMIEEIAAKKGIDLPSTHWQTWSKYLER
ncbi:TPA: hypothetical protein ACMEX2_003483 [Klebsiella pneumoniae]|nr:hypothetical protein [Klebsiella pneumoniae]HBW6477461.1 hypothetical protein [Klebsiella pneumoniae]HBZ1141166.1 hypothetical protein [Klebsiella pneumoniae]